MFKKILSLLLVLFVISTIAAPVYADQTVFGPKDLTIGRWHFHFSSHRFRVDDPAPGVLSIVKNTPDKKIRGGFCFVNGKYINLRSFLRGTSTLFEKDVQLRSKNRLTIYFRGARRASIKIEIKTKGTTSPPEVTFAADPATIFTGQSSTLSWTSNNADACVIEPGIGSVDLNGSTTVSPAQTTTYTITATGQGGAATENVIITAISPISLTITSPSGGENLSRSDVMVQGKITNAIGLETGVTVNGLATIVNEDQFVANHVPLQEGENTITATATDTAGNTETTFIAVNALPEDYIKITADTESGVSAFETILRVEGTFHFTESQLTYTGPDHIEILHSSADEYSLVITTEGFYNFTAEVTDSQGNMYTDTIAVNVLNKAELDTLLTAKWQGMREALIQGEIDRAVSSFDSFSKDAYKEIFNALSPRLPEIAQELGDIQFIRMLNNSAEYDIRTTRNGKEYSFYLMFVKNYEGIWKIRSF